MWQIGSSAAEGVGIDVAGVQEAEMGGVDVALERLQVIAVALDEERPDLIVGNVAKFRAPAAAALPRAIPYRPTPRRRARPPGTPWR